MSENQVRELRALLSLRGLSVGDALGETFFGSPPFVLPRIEQRTLPSELCRYTDDTEMAISIVEELRDNGRIDPYALSGRFAERADFSRGYGRGAQELLRDYARGGIWRHLSPSLFHGKGSWGNGAAMRVAPLGAWYADDIEKCVMMAKASAIVTHYNDEGIAGAVAVAVAAATVAAFSLDCDTFVAPSKQSKDALWKAVLTHTPPSMVLDGIKRAREMPQETSVSFAAETLGTGVESHRSVPFVIWSAANNLSSFEDAFWHTVRGLGDRDTTCAMVCGIVALSASIPDSMKVLAEEPVLS